MRGKRRGSKRPTMPRRGRSAARTGSHRLSQMTALVEQGILKPVVGAIYPLDDIVESHRHVQASHKRGGAAITL